MTLLERPLSSITAYNFNIPFKLKNVLIVFAIIGLGILLGLLNSSSAETAALTVSIVVILILLLIIVNNPLNGFLTLLVLMTFLEEWVEIPMGKGLPDLSFSRFAIPFLIIFMLSRAAIGKFRFAVPLSLAEICIVGTSIGLLSAALLSSNPIGAITGSTGRYVFPLMTYFFARQLVRDSKDLHRLLWAVAIFGLAAAIYAIYESSTGHILFSAKGRDVSELGTKYSENLYLIRGLLERAGNFARVFLSAIPVTFYLFFEQRKVGWKILLVGALVIQFYGMFITYNRTSWYALMAGLFLLQLFYPQFRKVYFMMIIVAAIVLAATWEQVNNSTVVNERINSDKVATLDKREARWQAGVNMWKVKPIRGWGFDAFGEQSGRFRTDGGHENWGSPENDFVYIMVASGLFGLLPYLVFLIAPLIDSLRLFFVRIRAPGWSGFIKAETIAIYWVTIVCYVIGSYTQIQNVPIVKMIPFALAGAIIGTHHHWLRRPVDHSVSNLHLAADTILEKNESTAV